MTLPKERLKTFRELLEAKRAQILENAQNTLADEMTLDADDLPDEMDLAASEYIQSFNFRLRGREKHSLEKIDRALQRLAQGLEQVRAAEAAKQPFPEIEFGRCEECGEEISLKRLEARPETTLCIKCKEDQERAEKDFS